LRDRSYFDESPAIFENGVDGSNNIITDGSNADPSASRYKELKVSKEGQSLGESVQIESQLPSNVNIHDIYNGTEDSMLQLKLNSGIQGSNNRMHIHSSNPSASIPISSRMSNHSISRLGDHH